MRLPLIFHSLHQRLQKMFVKRNEGGETATPSIQDIAGRLAEEQQRLRQLEATTTPKERTVLVLGSKCVGKTTAINKFFDREEHATRPTLALEYSFGRRIGSGKSPQVMNVWELGSLDNAEQLLEVPMRTHGLQQLAVVLMLDLSQPQRFWTDLECAYKGLRDTAQQMMEKVTPELREILEQRTVERVGQQNKDVEKLDPLPFPEAHLSLLAIDGPPHRWRIAVLYAEDAQAGQGPEGHHQPLGIWQSCSSIPLPCRGLQ
ncbi:cytoplasmic dynein 2 light intermediate chain 1 isoform X2 [Drosophila mauritiana]|uniref:Cytoplasmic dynein 2 light intermediate chain 1 n=1 Tax=Drosophila mauritiana TaxID=7226 RepID=A0A6P8KF68_DROMA|nr:cytoplasmic dynein 2 light intermediate chain 1 isoform X2 [Drosophila mauritiana]